MILVGAGPDCRGLGPALTQQPDERGIYPMGWVNTRMDEETSRYVSVVEMLETLREDGLIKDFHFESDRGEIGMWFITMHTHPGLRILALTPTSIRGFYLGCALGIDSTIDAVVATS